MGLISGSFIFTDLFTVTFLSTVLGINSLICFFSSLTSFGFFSSLTSSGFFFSELYGYTGYVLAFFISRLGPLALIVFYFFKAISFSTYITFVLVFGVIYSGSLVASKLILSSSSSYCVFLFFNMAFLILLANINLISFALASVNSFRAPFFCSKSMSFFSPYYSNRAANLPLLSNSSSYSSRTLFMRSSDSL